MFLRQAGAPLDNNICERALKKAILHRKNALFYKTQNGARVGDLFMSLIYTCQLNEVNPFDYLTQLQEHEEELAANPERWMPWNCRCRWRASPTNKRGEQLKNLHPCRKETIEEERTTTCPNDQP